MSLVVIDFFLLLTVSLLRLFSSVIIQLQYYFILFFYQCRSLFVCMQLYLCSFRSTSIFRKSSLSFFFFLSLNYAYPHCLLKHFFYTSLWVLFFFLLLLSLFLVSRKLLWFLVFFFLPYPFLALSFSLTLVVVFFFFYSCCITVPFSFFPLSGTECTFSFFFFLSTFSHLSIVVLTAGTSHNFYKNFFFLSSGLFFCVEVCVCVELRSTLTFSFCVRLLVTTR